MRCIMKSRIFQVAFFGFLLIYPYSCKKFVDRQKENALVDLVTNGTWRITKYIDHQDDITASFSGYVFQFKSNGTVDGIHDGQITSGTWVGNVNARTIQSEFPAAPDPLKKLNYTWTVTDSYSDSVSAKAVVDSSFNFLELHKN